MGLPIRVETRTGDTPSDRKARQRIRPPQILLTTPESLSLLLSYPDSFAMFENLKTIVVDELHGFAKEKRGDLLSLSMARLQKLAPGLRRVGLSATISDPDAYRSWLAPDADMDAVDVVVGDPGAEPDLSILIPEGRIPWGGHSGRHAVREVMELIEEHKTTLVFCNTRGLAELIFQDLWAVNDKGLPIGIHHGSLAQEARRKIEAAMAAGKLRGLVATASLDLGIDWGDVDLVVQMGAPEGLVAPAPADRPRQPPPRRAERGRNRPRQPLRISRGARRARRDRRRRARPRKLPPGNARRPCPAYPRRRLRRAVRGAGAARRNPLRRALCGPQGRDVRRGPELHRDRRLRAESLRPLPPPGPRGATATGASPGPQIARQHRLNAGRDRRAAPAHRALPQRPQARHDRGRLCLDARARAIISSLPASASRSSSSRTRDIIVHASSKSGADRHLRRAAHVDVDPPRQPRPPHARRPQRLAPLSRRRSRMARGAGAQVDPSPSREQLLVETFEHEELHYMVAYSFEGWNAHQSLGMLITRRMENAGLKPLGFVANDYALACYGLKPITDPEGALLTRHPRAGIRRLGRTEPAAEDRFPRGRGHRRARRAAPSGQEEIGPPGQLLDRPHLRRAAPLRAGAPAAARRLGRCPRADDGTWAGSSGWSIALRRPCSTSTPAASRRWPFR